MIHWYLSIGSRSLNLQVWEHDPVFCSPAYVIGAFAYRRGNWDNVRCGIEFRGRKLFDEGQHEISMAYWWKGKGKRLSIRGTLVRVTLC